MSARPKLKLSVVPHCPETEQAVIGYLISNPEAFDSHGHFLNEGSFFCPSTRAIWNVLVEVHEDGLPTTLENVGRRLFPRDLGPLADCVGNCPSEWPEFGPDSFVLGL